MYPAAAVRIMPGPRGLPLVRVTPEVSECRRMPSSLRRVSSATSACPPSWAMVISPRDSCHEVDHDTTPSAASADSSTTHRGGPERAVVRVTQRSDNAHFSFAA